jgi:hypothetical protein
MSADIIKYNISKIEINRRKKAFTSLIVSLLIFGILFSIDFIIKNIAISIIIIISVTIMLYLSRILTFKFFYNLLKTKVLIVDDYILRTFQKGEVKCFFKNIKYIKIKKTSKGYNREIKIISNSNTDIAINGLDKFQEFEQELIKNIDNKKIKYLKEPIDFDHLLFYPIFGMILSFIFIFGIKFLSKLDYQNIKLFYYTVFSINLFISLYIFFSKPLSKTFEKKKVNLDYVFSLCIILLSLFIYFFIFKRYY